MKKFSRKLIGLMLAVILCLSCAPLSALAAEPTEPIESAPIETEAPASQQPEASTEPVIPVPSELPKPEETEIPAEPQPTKVVEAPVETQLPEEIPEETLPTDNLGGNISVSAEPVKTVGEPLVQIVYNYYDADKNIGIENFENYDVESSHSYYALAKVEDEGIAIEANKFPEKVGVSTEAMRFRVLLDGETDITQQAAYNADSGTVALPYGFLGHRLTVMWYCPTTEITEVPIKVNISIGKNGAFTNTEAILNLPTNANSVSVEMPDVKDIIASQNGIDLSTDSSVLKDGQLNIAASPLGGDITVTAYKANAGGMTVMSTGVTQVVHTRSDSQIYYGYYTSYYEANGNTAFCLDPTVSGLNSGTYGVSRWLARGTDDLLIKCAYYLYGGPGYNGVKNNLFENPDSMEAYGLSHAAASYVFMGSEAFKGLDSGVIEHLKNVVASVNVQPMPPSGFDVFIYNEGGNNQCLMSWDYTPLGNAEFTKKPSIPDLTTGHDCYILKGAEYDVYDNGGNKVGHIVTDENGKARITDLNAGNFYLIETKAPKGYALDSTRIPFTITAGDTTKVDLSDVPQNDPVFIMLKKQDSDNKTKVAQGNASLAGAQFRINYYDGYYSKADEVNGVTPTRSWVVKTDKDGYTILYDEYVVSGDELYRNKAGLATLPLGTVTIQEIKAPTGYRINDETYVRQITAEGAAESVFTYNEPTVSESVIRGGVSIEKWDAETNTRTPQGDATLSKAVFEIYNRSKANVMVNGKSYAPGQVVYTMSTDENGIASTANNLLPYGSFEIIEKTAPTGYLNSGKIKQSFSITVDGKIVELKSSATAIKNDIIRGGVRIEKWDNETDENNAQGSGTLEGAVFEIVNRSKNSVVVMGKSYAPGEVVYTMTTDKTGVAETANDLLPYGTFEGREVTPPEGYLARGVLSRTFEIRTHGEIVNLNTTDTAIKNNPIRGDLKGIKIADGDAGRMANVPFSITSKTTGEGHVIVTDRNGEFNTSSEWNPHSQNTNRGETDKDGIWFGSIEKLNDDVGALLYDTYIIEELPCEANKDKKLLTVEVTVYRNSTVIDLGTLTDDYIPVPEIFTTAMDKGTTTNEAYASETSTIVDTVYYSGLTVGKTYTLHGTLMDKNAGKPLTIADKEVTAEKVFKATAETGSVTMEFIFDSSALVGKEVVVFERLELEGKEIAVHADIEDTEQTIIFKEPEISTTATGADGEKELLIDDMTTIKDVVSYANLIVGKEYIVKGTIMDKSTGQPLIANGNKVTAEKTFIPAEASGSVEMEFIFSSLALKGKEVVVFETLEYDGKEIAVHADIEDKGQTVKFKEPVIGTTATDKDGKKETPEAKVTTILDVVKYENLTPGKEYTLKGTLMDKNTGKALVVDGKTILSELKFTPSESSGSVTMEFVFDSSAPGKKEIVVFESLYRNDIEIAVHADIEDKAQTVTIRTPGGGAQTGGDGLPVWALIIAIACLAGIGGVSVILIRKSKKKGQKGA